MENLDSEPAATEGDSGDGSAGDDCTRNVSVNADGHYEYVAVKEEPEQKFVGVYYYPVKQEPELELGGGDGDAIDVNGYCGFGLPKEEPEPRFTASVGGIGDCGAGDDYASNIVVNDHYDLPKREPEPKLVCGDGAADDDYSLPKEDREFKFVNVHSIKEEPGLQLPDASGNAAGNGGGDVGYECSHCGVNLCTQEFKVEHELRCNAQMQRRKLELQITKLYYCGVCRCPFLNKEYKERHQQKCCRKKTVPAKGHTKATNFECDKCGYVAKQKYILKRHLLNHDKGNVEWLTCTQCSYKTVHKYDLTYHMKVHNNNAVNCCCPICGKSVRTKLWLDDHLIRRHFDNLVEVSKLITSEVYTCDICNQYRTASKANFNEHVTLTHQKGAGCQKYQCPLCPYTTFRERHLKTHSKTHAEQKDYRCTVCMKQFAQKRELDSHVLYKHADNVESMKKITSKIHQCTLCSFKTVQMTHLRSHVRVKH